MPSIRTKAAHVLPQARRLVIELCNAVVERPVVLPLLDKGMRPQLQASSGSPACAGGYMAGPADGNGNADRDCYKTQRHADATEFCTLQRVAIMIMTLR
jgi:hypothetical protein